MDIQVKGRVLSDRPLVLGVQGDNKVEEIRFLVSRYTGAGVDLSEGIGYAVFRLPDGTDGQVAITPEVISENTVSMTLLIGSEMTTQKGSGKLCLKVAGLESAMWSSAICDIFIAGTIDTPSRQPLSLFKLEGAARSLTDTYLAADSEPPFTVTERTINVPAELQTIAVAQDENSESVKIVVPRYFDGVDLSVHDFILHTEMGSNGVDDILFNNQNGQMKSVEATTVNLTWVLRPPQTSYEGKLKIQLFVQGDNFKWHSFITELTVAKHISGDPIIPTTPSMYEQWLAEVRQQADYVRSQAGNIQTVVDNLQAIKDAPTQAANAAASAAEAKAAAQESKGFRTFYSSVRPDDNGNLDPSRPMFAGSGTSVNIEAKGDRVESVTVNGYTQQAGSGDPSPVNQRTITVGGMQANLLIHDITTKTVYGVTATSNKDGTITFKGTATGSAWFNLFTKFRTPITGDLYFSGRANGFARSYIYFDKGESDNGAVFFDDRGDGVSFKIAPDDGYTRMQISVNISSGTRIDATVGFVLSRAKAPYTPYTGAKYGTVITTNGDDAKNFFAPLNAPLCDGDTIQSNVPSGCDKVVVFDGSADEKWVLTASGTVNKRFGISEAAVGAVGGKGNFLSNYLPTFTAEEGKQETPYLFVYGGGYADANIPGIDTVEDWRSHLSKNPLTVRYRSTSYTPDKDLPACLEEHARITNILTGDEDFKRDTGWGNKSAFNVYAYLNGAVNVGGYETIADIKCSHARTNKPSTLATTDGLVGVGQGGGTTLYVSFGAGYDSAEKVQQYCKEQIAAGTPITIEYPLATPAVYAQDPIDITATPYTASTTSNSVMMLPELPDVPTTLEQPISMAAGNPGTFDVTSDGTSTVDVYLKAMQDGGKAATAQSVEHALSIQLNGGTATTFNGSEDKQINITPNSIGSAPSSHTHSTAQITGMLDLLYPVGSIFEWSNNGISSAPDLSTVAKVQSHFGGTWEAYGAGQVTVAVDASQTEFNAVGKTGGEKESALTVPNLPPHEHKTAINTNKVYSATSGGDTFGVDNEGEAPTGSTGEAQPFSNLQPYVVVYRYRRIG